MLKFKDLNDPIHAYDIELSLFVEYLCAQDDQYLEEWMKEKGE